MRNILLGLKFLYLNFLNKNRDPYLEIVKKKYGRGYFDFAIDVGAASGDWSTAFVKYLKIEKVLCLEPNREFYVPTWIGCMPYTFIGKIKLMNAAISSSKKDIFLIVRQDGQRLRYRSFVAEKVGDNQHGFPVRCCSLDELGCMRGAGILKIDVEGNEFDVLKSGSREFFDGIQCIVFEHNLDSDNNLLEEIRKYLEGLNFTIYSSVNGVLVKLFESELSTRRDVNLIAFKDD